MRLIAKLSVAVLAGLATPAGAQVAALTSPGQIATIYLNNFDTGVKNGGPVTFDAGSVIDTATNFSNGVTTSGAFGLRSQSFPGLITANLSSSYNAVGLYFGNDDVCCSTGFSPILSAYNGATLLGSVSVVANMNDNVDQFIGLSSVTAFDRITISYGTASLYAFIDDFRLGTPAAAGAVPEPATWAMMLLGFGAIGGSLRRRSKVATRIRFA